MADEFDPFAQDSGLKSNFDGTVTDAWFAMQQYGTQLTLKVLADDGDEVERFYGCGQDWQTNDGGKTVEHPTKKIIGTQSKLGELVRHAFQCGGETELRNRDKEHQLGPRRADLWLGTKWHWEILQREITMQGKPQTVTTMIPTAYLGTGDTVVKSAVAANGDSFPDDLRAQATVLAKSNDYAAWTDKMMAIGDSVMQNPVVMSALADEAFYEKLKG